MSIDTVFNKLFSKVADYKRILAVFRRFLQTSKAPKNGFWIIELLISMAILSGIMLLLFRFGANVMAAEHDAVMRLQAINIAKSHLESNMGKNHSFSQNISNMGDFTLSSKISPITPVQSNFPESIKKALKKHVFAKHVVAVSWNSQGGVKRNIELFSFKPGGFK